MRTLLADPTTLTHRRTAARDRFQSAYSSSENLRQLEEIYRTALRHGGASRSS